MKEIDPSARYREYLRSFGIVDAGDRVAELRDLDAGNVRFFAYIGGDDLRFKAAVTPDGLVTPGGQTGDDWYGLLAGMPDALSSAERIAWLETDASTPPHGLQPAPALALFPDRRPEVGMDPAQWRLVTAPALESAGDCVTLVAWILPSGMPVPQRWMVSARRGAPAAIERLSAFELLAAGAGGIDASRADATRRARRLLAAGTDDERWWGLQQIGDAGDRTAVAEVLALLADAGASPTVRLAAAGTLARLADPVAVASLGDALRDSAPEVRRAVALALGRIGGSEALQALGDAVSDEPDLIVRAEIVHALAAQGNAARESLARIARSDPDQTIRKLAQGSVDVM
jgi:hypothetical protein